MNQPTYESILGGYPSSWYIPYDILLKTKEWNDFRQNILDRDKRTCTVCNRKESEKHKGVYYRMLSDEEILANQREESIDLTGDGTFVVKSKVATIIGEPTDKPVILHVHHKYYIFDDCPWDYPDSAVTTVCHDCHVEIHNSVIIPVYTDETRKERLKLTICNKCSGTGFIREYYYYHNGICFKCMGRKYTELIR